MSSFEVKSILKSHEFRLAASFRNGRDFFFFLNFFKRFYIRINYAIKSASAFCERRRNNKNKKQKTKNKK